VIGLQTSYNSYVTAMLDGTKTTQASESVPLHTIRYDIAEMCKHRLSAFKNGIFVAEVYVVLPLFDQTYIVF